MKIQLGPGTRVGYLSAAPRVSTRDDAEAAGPRSHVLGVIRAFEATGARVDRFIVGDRMPAVVRTRSEGVLARSRWRGAAADIARLGLGAFNSRRAVRQLSSVDWVYERAAAMQFLGGAFRKRGIPWVLETQSPVFHEARHERGAIVLERVAKHVELAAYRDCDAIVAVSKPLRDILVELGVEGRKIIVLPNGVDTRVFDPAAHVGAPRIFPGFTIGFVGALIAWQGLDVLLRAVAGVDAPIHVAIAGSGQDRVRLESLVGELGLASRVRFLGRLPGSGVPAFLAGVDVGFSGQQAMQIGSMYHSPLKLYEYLSMGTPAIASAFDDARAVIEEGRTGFLFEPGSERALELALERAYAARDALPQLGMHARATIVSRHSWDARVQTLLEALRSI